MRNKICGLIIVLGLAMSSCSSSTQGTSEFSVQSELFSESFDDISNPAHFTHRLPQGWEGTTQGVTSGEARWNGWAISTIRDWTWAAETDQRQLFTRAHNQVAIIDSHQQRLNATDSMTAAMRTSWIDLKENEQVEVSFDSHYRQGNEHQYAVVRAYFDNQQDKPVELLRLTQDKFSSREALNVDVPDNAESIRLEFIYADSNNDWFWAVDNLAVRTVMPEVQGEPRIIDVISDVQGDIDDYTQAVEKLNSMPDKAKALVINGDIVDGGTEELWEEFHAAAQRTSHVSGKTILVAGNHEMYGKEDSATHLQRFYKYSGENQAITETLIDDIPIITIASEYYSDNDREGKEPFVRLSQKSLDFLDQRLKHWQEEGVTPLVFAHYLLPQTVSMSHSAWYQNDFEDLEALSDVLNKYNNLIFFSSHSHSSLTKQHDWWGIRRYDGTGQVGKLGFPVVNTGAILNEYLPDGDHDEKIVSEEASTGLRVKVYDDRVRVEVIDFKKDGKVEKFQDFPRR